MTAMVDDETLDFSTSDDVQIVESFDAMGLKDELLRGIYAYGGRPGAGGRDGGVGLTGGPPRAQALRSRPPSSSAPSCR